MNMCRMPSRVSGRGVGRPSAVGRVSSDRRKSAAQRPPRSPRPAGPCSGLQVARGDEYKPSHRSKASVAPGSREAKEIPCLFTLIPILPLLSNYGQRSYRPSSSKPGPRAAIASGQRAPTAAPREAMSWSAPAPPSFVRTNRLSPASAVSSRKWLPAWRSRAKRPNRC